MWWLVAMTYRYLTADRRGEDARTAVRYLQAFDQAAAAQAAEDDVARLCPAGRHPQFLAVVVVYAAQVREGLRDLVDGWPV